VLNGNEILGLVGIVNWRQVRITPQGNEPMKPSASYGVSFTRCESATMKFLTWISTVCASSGS
jgi:hypothetical protein